MERADLEQWKGKEVSRLLALVETERRYYQEMVAMLPVPLVVLSADRHVSSANRAFRQTFGLRSIDLRGKPITEILPSDRLIENIRDAHVSGVPHTAFPLEHEGRQFSLAVVPMRNWDDEGEVETLLMVQEAVGVKAFGRRTERRSNSAPCGETSIDCSGSRRRTGPRLRSFSRSAFIPAIERPRSLFIARPSSVARATPARSIAR
jgi:PAS domain S-box-containing protein